MKSEILKLLRESDDYISGQQLCEQFGVSRQAVWKVINQLKEEGYEVEAVRNRGYRIINAPDVITAEELLSQMNTQWAGQTLYYYDETDSTNIRARQFGNEGAPHGTLVVADCQNAGRGRRGRTWESPSGSSISMSLLLRPEFPPAKARMLTLVMALSAVEGLKEETGLDIRVKWPNDLVVNGKKIVGILTEMSTEIDFINYVIIGTGINVNTEFFPDEIKETATSLKKEAGHQIRRSPLIAAVMRHFEENYNTFLETLDLTGLQERYSSYLINKDKDVLILGAAEPYEAHALGINSEGELMIRKQDGTVEAVYAGEVSVRGLYGYT